MSKDIISPIALWFSGLKNKVKIQTKEPKDKIKGLKDIISLNSPLALWSKNYQNIPPLALWSKNTS